VVLDADHVGLVEGVGEAVADELEGGDVAAYAAAVAGGGIDESSSRRSPASLSSLSGQRCSTVWHRAAG